MVDTAIYIPNASSSFAHSLEPVQLQTNSSHEQLQEKSGDSAAVNAPSQFVFKDLLDTNEQTSEDSHPQSVGSEMAVVPVPLEQIQAPPDSSQLPEKQDTADESTTTASAQASLIDSSQDATDLPAHQALVADLDLISSVLSFL